MRDSIIEFTAAYDLATSNTYIKTKDEYLVTFKS